MFGRWSKAGHDTVVRPGSVTTGDQFHISYEMMVKGFVYKRRTGLVRQFGVTVNGATRLVTSGDVVDRPTYDALVAAGVIRPKNAGSNPNGAASDGGSGQGSEKPKNGDQRPKKG
ncbi:MAG: hypothetical protein WD873_05925 [Candidatus Hydrogenedentales bacterium]